MDYEHQHYDWLQVPPGQYTKKQLLKRHRRLQKNAESVGTITCVFDKPRRKPKKVEAVPPEECQQIRKKLTLFGLDAADQMDLYRLDQAGQLAAMNLYAIRDSEPITRFKEKEAKSLLESMVWDYSHEDHYITEATVDGQRQRATWKSEFSTPDLTAHLAGERYFGVKKGHRTMQVTVDGDRHSGKVSGEDHVAKTLRIGRVLTKHFPRYRFAPEINPQNGSVKFFGWLPDYVAVPLAEQIAERVRSVLQGELPEYDFGGLEIYPSNSPQIFAPLRADKVTVIGTGVVAKVKKYRMQKSNGKRRRQYYEAHSCADYLNWVYFSDTQYNEPVFEQVLRESVARCPDEQVEEARTEKRRAKTKVPSGGMGSIGKLKGRCARTLVRFWSELDVPEDDTVGKYVIVTLRILKYEGLSEDEAVAWVEDRLRALEYTGFSDRLTDDFQEIQRVMAYAVEAVWQGNGYQKDPASSEEKLRATVAAWSGKGFYLHDPDTWEDHKPAQLPEMKVVWTETSLALIPELTILAHTTQDQARVFIERVLAFVEKRNELSESMVGKMLESSGIKGKCRQKQHDMHKFLVENGLLVKQRNYFCDKSTGYRHGNFYICSEGVRFEEETQHNNIKMDPQDDNTQGEVPGDRNSQEEECFQNNTHPVSIVYLSMYIEPLTEGNENWLDLVMEGRRLACDRRYRERLGRLRTLLSRAA